VGRWADNLNAVFEDLASQNPARVGIIDARRLAQSPARQLDSAGRHPSRTPEHPG
jgi:hypothetical protein